MPNDTRDDDVEYDEEDVDEEEDSCDEENYEDEDDDDGNEDWDDEEEGASMTTSQHSNFPEPQPLTEAQANELGTYVSGAVATAALVVMFYWFFPEPTLVATVYRIGFWVMVLSCVGGFFIKHDYGIGALGTLLAAYVLFPLFALPYIGGFEGIAWVDPIVVICGVSWFMFITWAQIRGMSPAERARNARLSQEAEAERRASWGNDTSSSYDYHSNNDHEDSNTRGK